jgi:hypothetical protein
MAVMQELSHCDKVAERLIGLLSNDIMILMIDETLFYLSGTLDKQNFFCWAKEDPQLLHQVPLHGAHMTLRCGSENFGVVGPYFFEDEDGRVVTVTSARYV